eukprot:14393882-Alexandrium_andersonii.AAC.1
MHLWANHTARAGAIRDLRGSMSRHGRFDSPRILGGKGAKGTFGHRSGGDPVEGRLVRASP